MKKDRKELNRYLEQCLNKYVADSKTESKIISECYDVYGIPPFRAQTIIRLDASTTELKDVEIFWVLSAISLCNPDAKICLDEYFTDVEIENYSRMKYGDNEKTKFPIVLQMQQVTDTQWIGAIKASTLIRWRREFLRYNKNIQRQLTTVMNNGESYETITLNNSSIEEMKSLFIEGKFIPNVITLNIDDSSNCEFYYDKENRVLIINKIEHIDLIDGYHRLVALSKVFEENPFFEYDMELRITNLSDMRAAHFIWQEEQRTVLPKRSVATYNMDDIGNKITIRVNENASCNLSGNIMRGGLVDFSAFAGMVNQLYIANASEDDRRTAIVRVTKDLIDGINSITENDFTLISRKLTLAEVRILVYCCHQYFGEPKGGIYDTFRYLMDFNYTTKDKKSLTNGKEKRIIKILDDALKKRG